MKWLRALIYERKEVGVDDTNNPITELTETDRSILVRSGMWKPMHDSTEGNQFDFVERTFLTKAKPELLDGAVALKVHGVVYTVESITCESNPIAIRVKRCKDGL